MPGIDRARRFFAALAQVHHGLDLAADVVGRTGGHFGFLHQLEQVGLNAPAADIPAVDVGNGGDFINLINVNNAVLGALGIPIRPAQQLPDKVFNVPADVARFGKLGRVALDKRHADQVGGVANEVSFAHARR